MAKPRSRRRSSSQVLRLQRLAILNQIVGLCAILLVASVFTPSQSNRLKSAAGVGLSVAKASDDGRVCTFSKRGTLRRASRGPKRKKLPVLNRLGAWPALGPTRGRRGVPANDR
jgi:hypothetical protein